MDADRNPPLGGDEGRAEVGWVRAELFNRRPQAGTDGQESGGWEGDAMAARAGGPGRYTVQRKCDGGPAAARAGIGTQYNARYAG
jgi:hypothetical protein